MADYLCSGSGFYDLASTWGGAGVPGDGDTFTIPFPYVVTVRDLRVSGTSPNDRTTIVNTVEGTIRVADGGSYRPRGNVRTVGQGAEHAVLIVEQGGEFLFDPSQSLDPATTSYQWEAGIGAGNFGVIRALGTAQNRAVIGTVAGGAKGRFIGTDSRACVPELDYCDVDLGYNGEYGFDGSQSFRYHIRNCRFNQATPGGGVAMRVSTQSWARVQIHGNNFRNTLSEYALFFNRSTLDGGVDNWIRDNAFDQMVWINTALDLDMSRNVFAKGLISTGGPPSAMDLNCVGFLTAQPWTFPRTSITNHLLVALSNENNQHYLDFGNQPAGDYDVTGNIFTGDFGTTGDRGDVVLLSVGLSGAGGTITVTKNITVPRNGDHRFTPGVVTLHGNAFTDVVCDYNTFVNMALQIGETYAGHVDQVKGCRANVVWAEPTAANRYIINAVAQTLDHARGENVTHNVGHNLQTGSNGYGYNNMLATNAPGANDLNEDPDFVDKTRNLESWSASLGGPATLQGAIDLLLTLNGADEVQGANVSAAMGWIRGGFAPQNQNLKASSHEGLDRGAVDVVAPATPSTGHYNPLQPMLIK